MDYMAGINPAAEIGNLNNQIAQEQQGITQLYTQIGQQYYAENNANPAPSLAGFVQAINDAQARIAGIQDQIDILNGLIKCPACNAKVAKTNTFCTKCGYRLVPEPPAPAGKVCAGCGATLIDGQKFCTNCGMKTEEPPAKICANCGTALQADQKFCINCGTKAEEAPAAAPVQEAPAVEEVVAPAPEPIPEPIPEPTPAPAVKTCAQCGAILEEGQVFCIMCGMRVEQPAPAPAPANAKQFCVNCGNEIPDGAAFCVICGTRQ